MKLQKLFRLKGGLLFGLAAAVCLAASLPVAAQADTFEYDLFNRPPGGIFFPPSYGLILDGLLDADEHFTFSFEDTAGNSTVSLVYDDVANSVRIFGTVFGGVDAGDEYDPTLSGVWNLDFTYRANVNENSGDGSDILVTGDSADNNGFISPTFDILGVSAGEEISLVDMFNAAQGFSFQFNNTDAQDIISNTPDGDFLGWGWLTYNTFVNEGVHVSPSDFIFTGRRRAEPIPEPSTMLLLGAGMAGLASRRKRKKA